MTALNNLTPYKAALMGFENLDSHFALKSISQVVEYT